MVSAFASTDSEAGHFRVGDLFANRLLRRRGPPNLVTPSGTRPNHTSVWCLTRNRGGLNAAPFRDLPVQKTAARSFSKSGLAVCGEHFGLTQTETGPCPVWVACRTVQNWERSGCSREPASTRTLRVGPSERSRSRARIFPALGLAIGSGCLRRTASRSSF